MNNLRIALVATLVPLCALIFAANTTARAAVPACTPLAGIVRDSTAAANVAVTTPRFAELTITLHP